MDSPYVGKIKPVERSFSVGNIPKGIANGVGKSFKTRLAGPVIILFPDIHLIFLH